MMEMEQRAEQYVRILSTKFAGGVAVLTIAGGVLAYYRLHNHHRRTIDPDWYVSKPSHPSPKRPESQAF
jgi:hypothetical protein